ncbi:hypothetical protein JL721_6340 [Aureococcus anophagefferens]|nr:hypothetical protein JL721_6340 [Aureococcus anophagefferens]
MAAARVVVECEGESVLVSRATFLELGDEKLAVVLNPPSVASLDCYAAPTVGRELRAIVAVKHCAPADVAWRWRVGDDVASEAAVYVPTDAHLGPKPKECVRVLTYNVLADAYRHTWDAGIHLCIHTHCPPEKTLAEYRVPLAVDEVLDFAPDVVALQEVDAKWFERLWRPRTADTYDGFLTVKSGKSFEGSALLWKTADWREVDRREVALSRGRDDAAYPGGPRGASRASRLVVANTHLFFAGRATHVRVVLLASVLRAAKELKERHGGDVVLCGDLNAEAHDGALRLLLDGTVPADHLDWIIGDTFSWGYASCARMRACARDDGAALLDEEIPQAEAAIEALYQAAEAAKAAAHEAQRALVAAAEDDPAETPVGAGLATTSPSSRTSWD